jgi:hypothetical protein
MLSDAPAGIATRRKSMKGIRVFEKVFISRLARKAIGGCSA